MVHYSAVSMECSMGNKTAARKAGVMVDKTVERWVASKAKPMDGMRAEHSVGSKESTTAGYSAEYLVGQMVAWTAASRGLRLDNQ